MPFGLWGFCFGSGFASGEARTGKRQGAPRSLGAPCVAPHHGYRMSGPATGCAE